MTTRCLRLRSPIFQLLRHPLPRHSSPGVILGLRKYAQQGPNETEDAPLVGDRRVAKLLKPNYEPSPIFGVVKPTQQEALKKPISRKQKEKSIAKRRETEKSKIQVTQDDKMYIYKSLRLKTSVKKLGNLTRQIANKDIDFAITQMRFSPKRAARSILRGLEHAKEEAIRLQNMQEGQIIVDQAWVGRNTYRKQLWPRARGRTNIRMRPHTHFTVMLRTLETVNKRIAKVKQRKLESMVRRPKDTKPIYNARPYYTW